MRADVDCECARCGTTDGRRAGRRRRRPRPRLRPVADPTPRLARFPFLLVMIGIFGLGMAGLLMLNTTLQNQAFEARALNRQATELAYVQADLEQQLECMPRRRELARVASELGMRPNPHPAFLVLPEGRVVGEPTPVSGDEVKSSWSRPPSRSRPRRRHEAAKAKAAAEEEGPRRRRPRRSAPRRRRRRRPAAEKKQQEGSRRRRGPG